MEILRIKTASGDIILWKVCESLEELEGAITLTDCESDYYNTISSESRRKEWLASRVIVRKELGVEVSTKYKNRIPTLIGSDLFLSISHCDNLVAVYLSDVPCGVDIENFCRNFDRVASRFLSAEELTYIKGKDVALAWSIKEAAYKRIRVSDIDFATMFTIKKIDREGGFSILSYNNVDYKFKFIGLRQQNLVY